MGEIARLLYPVLLAGVDIGAGSLLYRYVSAVHGLPMIAVGVLVVCSVAYHVLSDTRPVLRQRLRDVRSRALRSER